MFKWVGCGNGAVYLAIARLTARSQPEACSVKDRRGNTTQTSDHMSVRVSVSHFLAAAASKETKHIACEGLQGPR